MVNSGNSRNIYIYIPWFSTCFKQSGISLNCCPPPGPDTTKVYPFLSHPPTTPPT